MQIDLAVVYLSGMTDPLSTLVLGGARSGKSRFAEKLAAESGLQQIYIATAQTWDDEMRQRVATHVERRGDAWTTVEEPLNLVEALKSSCSPGAFVLVDCLTLWLTNIMLAERDIAEESAELLSVIRGLPGPCALVSNEVGYGIVPENALARRFRDEAGLLNQRLAEVCGHVVLVAAGLPLTLKGSPTK